MHLPLKAKNYMFDTHNDDDDDDDDDNDDDTD